MSTSDESVYEFCDKDIPSYEMTIYTLAMAYAESPFFSADDEMISELAQLLRVDEELLKYALSLNKPVAIRYPRGGDGIKAFNQLDHAEKMFDFSEDKLIADYITHQKQPIDINITGRINIVE